MNTGKYLWRIPFGEIPALAAKGMKNTGSANVGGGVVTASGLLFIGATSLDSKFHVFDAKTGKLVWETLLPAPGTATPATYMVGGKQFVAITTSGARGGNGDGETAGGGAPRKSELIAFALPQ